MEVASDAATRLGGNPEVGATSVKNNLEGLRWGADGDLGEVYVVVSDGNHRGQHI